MQVSESNDGIYTVTIQQPRLDAPLGLKIRESINMRDQSNPVCVIDLSQVKLVDSGGLGALVALLKQLKSQNGQLALTGLQKPVRMMFELARMDRQFQLFDTPAQAAAALKG